MLKSRTKKPICAHLASASALLRILRNSSVLRCAARMICYKPDDPRRHKVYFICTLISDVNFLVQLESSFVNTRQEDPHHFFNAEEVFID